MTAETRTVRALVRGKVQGVGFRAWTQHQAQLHGLVGFVRNLRDGSVEAVASGPADLVAVFVKALDEGPRFARVEAVDIEDAQAGDLASGVSAFEVLPTG